MPLNGNRGEWFVADIAQRSKNRSFPARGEAIARDEWSMSLTVNIVTLRAAVTVLQCRLNTRLSMWGQFGLYLVKA